MSSSHLFSPFGITIYSNNLSNGKLNNQAVDSLCAKACNIDKTIVQNDIKNKTQGRDDNAWNDYVLQQRLKIQTLFLLKREGVNYRFAKLGLKVGYLTHHKLGQCKKDEHGLKIKNRRVNDYKSHWSEFRTSKIPRDPIWCQFNSLLI